MSNILVTGSASGIGKAFVEAFAQQPTVSVIFALDHAFTQDHPVAGIFKLPNCPPKIMLLTVDVTQESTVLLARDRIQAELTSRDATLDTLIHSAGVRGLDPGVAIHASSEVATAETLQNMTSDTLNQTLQVNATGTFIVLKALAPLLKTNPASSAKVMIMSSRMGSIGHNRTGGGYAYRASKAAQNALVRSLACDMPEVTWTLIHPGRVETRLVCIKEDGAMHPEESVIDMMALLPTLGSKHSGQFIDRFGQSIPW